MDVDQARQLNWRYLFTSFEGKITRKPFWIGQVVLIIANLIISLALGLLAGLFAPMVYLSYVVAAVLLFASLAVSAKRWHDRGKSGWWSLVMLVPIVGPLYMLYQLGFLVGVERPGQETDATAEAANP